MADDERTATAEEAGVTTDEEVTPRTDDQGSGAAAGDERLSTADLVRDTAAVDDDGEESAVREPLFAGDDAERFRSRWQEVQAGFVDEPQQAVKDADSLVAELMQRLAETFSQERTNLESQWGSGDDASTEDLRVALQRYRSFFDRLLSA